MGITRRSENGERRRQAGCIIKKVAEMLLFGGGGGQLSKYLVINFHDALNFLSFLVCKCSNGIDSPGPLSHYIPQLQLHQNPQKSCHRLKIPRNQIKIN